jgi:hypothetical protein
MTRQKTAVAVSLAALLLGLLFPGLVGWLLVIAALSAAVCCSFAAQRLEPVVAVPWSLIALGQLLNGLGNMVIAFDTKKWVEAPDWVSSVNFNSATILTVLGIVGLCLGPEARRVVPIAVDLLVITGCALGLGVMFDVGRFIGHPAGEAVTMLGLMGFLAVVVGFVGLGFGVVAWNAQPSGRRTANRLAVLAHVSATLGDTEMLGNYLGIPFELVSLTWLASSLLILVAASFLGNVGEPTKWISHRNLSRIAVGFAAVQLVSLFVRPAPHGEVRVILAVVLTVAVFRMVVLLGSPPERSKVDL